MRDIFEGALGVALLLLIFGVAILQMALGFLGLDYLLGQWAGWVALALALLFRIYFPLTVGAYFGVVEVLHYPWWAGVLAALPGLLLIIPGLLAAAIGSVTSRR